MAIKCNLVLLMAAGLLPATHATVPRVEGLHLTWSDDFVGAANSLPNTANWQPATGTSYPGGAANWGTNEIETVSWPFEPLPPLPHLCPSKLTTERVAFPED